MFLQASLQEMQIPQDYGGLFSTPHVSLAPNPAGFMYMFKAQLMLRQLKDCMPESEHISKPL